MFVVVPVGCFCLISFTLYRAAQRFDAPSSWRRIVLTASVVWGTFLTGVTECLSYFTRLTFGWVLTLWILACLVAVIGYLWLGHGKPLPEGGLTLSAEKRARFPLFLLILIGGGAAIAGCLAVIALAAPPNTWDSMTYHMPRVSHWIQNESVAFYPTNIIRQLHQPPWAEYAILHLQLLSGGDAFANMVSWFSMIGSTIAVSLIAQQLGADLRGQAFAAIIAVTIPIGILEASGTQNDYVVSFWLACCIYYLLAYRARPSWSNALIAGASLGLALLTKGTAYVFVFPFLLWFGIWGIRTLCWQLWKPALAMLLPALAINISFYLRNLLLFGNPLGPANTVKLYSNDVFSLSTLVSNLIRNLSLEIGTPSSRINSFLEQIVTHLLSYLGINPDNPQTTWHGSTFQINGGHGSWTSEVLASNPIHFALLLVVIVLCLTFSRLRKQRLLLQYLAVLAGSFVLYCLYLKWQPWGSRLLLPLTILTAPLCGAVLAELPRVQLTNTFIALLLLASWPWVLKGQERPLLGNNSVLITPRLDQYFVNRPYLEAPYLGAIHFLESTGCQDIGLLIGGPDDQGYPTGLSAWEYPLWVLLDPENHPGRHIEQVHITNSSAPLAYEVPFASFHPCAIIAIRFLSDQSSALSSNGEWYQQAWSSGPVDHRFTVDVFMHSSSALAPQRAQASTPGGMPPQTNINCPRELSPAPRGQCALPTTIPSHALHTHLCGYQL